ncbi:hypothetical protein GXP67_04325 [Rhodocytophaga rosea]|uniref:Uncharacterized protein n=1 Tax=Rhodocytophaga rosea TaxID=2704465 RepID=A0A6C0GE40_9BACT|nr:hypothetical protein [Rhodocytophaga rosea]QHT65950.1 hypothetical protein GXP67_04325 [Rhodocytophaga rosea]
MLTLLLKFVFYVVAGFSGLVAAFYFVMTVLGIFFPKSPHQGGADAVWFAVGYGVALGLLGWAYHLAIIQGRIGAGFLMILIAYVSCIVFFIVLLMFSKGRWN